MSMLRITDSVGIGAKNKAEDIKAVQTALNKILHLIPPTQKVIVNGSLGSVPANSNTVKAIKAFQRQILRYAAPMEKLISMAKRIRKLMKSSNLYLLHLRSRQSCHG
ncbi:peptidoglycan-binding protein [Vibrio vulnificus]